jgi:hypothetical protein
MLIFLRVAMLVQIMDKSFKFISKFDNDCRFSLEMKDKIDTMIRLFKRDHLTSFITITKPIAVQANDLLEYFTKNKLLMAGYKIDNIKSPLFEILDQIFSQLMTKPKDIMNINATEKSNVHSIVSKLIMLNANKR